MTDTLLLRGGIACDAPRPDLPRAVGHDGGGAARPAPLDDPPVSRFRRLLSSLFSLALVALVVFLWPAALGGNTRLVIVSGHSMEPTYDFGDIVIVRDGGRSDVGDAVVFEVPDGTAEGMLVIHRIVAVDADGFFVTQGDNRDTPDQWQLTDDNIVGHPWLQVPKGGQAVWFLRQWTVLAILIGLLTVVILWPSKDDPGEIDVDSDDRDRDAPPPDVADTLLADTLLADSPWPDNASDPDMMAQANAWLDAQLAATMRDSTVEQPLDRRIRRSDAPVGAAVVAEPETAVQRIRARVLQTAR